MFIIEDRDIESIFIDSDGIPVMLTFFNKHEDSQLSIKNSKKLIQLIKNYRYNI